MPIIADLHVHFYSNYYLDSFLANIFKKLSDISNNQGSLGLITLTETDSCNFYQSLRSSQLKLPEEYQLEELTGALLITKASQRLIIIPGRQVNTVERLELLSLGSDTLISSGQSLSETLQQIESEQAVAVLNWAPGKWWFKRGKLIKEWIESSEKPYTICDTSLRPLCYPTPCLTQLAKKHNWKCIYGSDPLPDKSEEANVFKYYAVYDVEFDFEEPLKSFKDMIDSRPEVLGRRSSFFELFLRMYRYYKK